MHPLVSILIPAFNAQAWIAETIQSALAQTWPRKEIIVVDDGSTDATLGIARRYASSSLKVIHQENGGASRARNRALRECQGHYIQWLDADDLLSPDKIERQIACAERHSEPGFLFASAWGRFYYRPRNAKFHPTPLWRDLDPVEWMVLRLANPWPMYPPSWLVSRWLTERVGPWDERLSLNDDGEYFCRVVSHSSYVKFVSESLSYYRMANPSSLSRSRSRKAWESLCLSIDLEVNHVLARADSERTRAACAKRLNVMSCTMNSTAPDLADRLRHRISDLGGKVEPEKLSRKYALIQRIMGDKNAWLLKTAIWRTHHLICCRYEYILAGLFGRTI